MNESQTVKMFDTLNRKKRLSYWLAVALFVTGSVFIANELKLSLFNLLVLDFWCLSVGALFALHAENDTKIRIFLKLEGVRRFTEMMRRVRGE